MKSDFNKLYKMFYIEIMNWYFPAEDQINVVFFMFDLDSGFNNNLFLMVMLGLN